MLRVALAVALALSGCASVQRQILQSPAAGGEPWSELETEHFVVKTDQSEWAAKQALETFDQITRALLTLALPKGAKPPANRLDVVLFSHLDDLQTIVGNKHVGAIYHFNIDGSPPSLLVATEHGFVDTFDRTRMSMQHELTHWIFHNAVPGTPRWLDEGLATYWESLRLEDGQAIIGSLPPLMLLADWPSTADLFAANYNDFVGEGGGRYYSAAWGTVYLLYTKHPTEFARYLELLTSGARGEAAWRGAFGSFGARELDAERDWFAADRPWAHTVPLAVPLRDIASGRHIAPADVHLLWAQLRPWTDASLPSIAADLATAERLAPDSPSVQASLAQLELRQGHAPEAMGRIDRALVADPDDATLLRLRGEILVERELARPVAERNFSAAAALAARVAAIDSSSVALRFCARVAGLAGDGARSVALAERATARAPDCVACFDTLAVAKLAAGDLDGAVQAEATAVRLMPDGMIDRAMLRRLEEMKAEAKRR